MARVFDPTPEQERGWQQWVSERPPSVKAIAERFPPWELFRMKSTGHRVIVYSIATNGTVCVVVSGQFNLIEFERRVFGIVPDDLEPCELPAEGERVGSAMTQEEVLLNIDRLRVAIRPDLWELAPDGKARKKLVH